MGNPESGENDQHVECPAYYAREKGGPPLETILPPTKVTIHPDGKIECDHLEEEGACNSSIAQRDSLLRKCRSLQPQGKRFPVGASREDIDEITREIEKTTFHVVTCNLAKGRK